MRLNERRIFLLDGVGAVLSSLGTGIVLPFFAQWTGVPVSVTTPLAVLGFCFAVYSLSCFQFVSQIRAWMLLTIVGANLFYCGLALGVVVDLEGISIWGRVYFVVEIFIVAGVVLLETTLYRRFFRAGPR